MPIHTYTHIHAQNFNPEKIILLFLLRPFFFFFIPFFTSRPCPTYSFLSRWLWKLRLQDNLIFYRYISKFHKYNILNSRKIWSPNPLWIRWKGRLKTKVGFLYSATYTVGLNNCDQPRFTISEVAVDWQKPMVLQRKLRPSIACV